MIHMMLLPLFGNVTDTEWASLTVKHTVIDRPANKACRDSTNPLMQQMMQHFA